MLQCLGLRRGETLEQIKQTRLIINTQMYRRLIMIELFIVKTIREQYFQTQCHQRDVTLCHGQSTLYPYRTVHTEVRRIFSGNIFFQAI